MRKFILRKTSYFALFLLVLQLFLPIASPFAEESSMLPPSNLAVQQVTPDDVKLTWSSVFGATGYNVYEIKEGQLILLSEVTTTSYTLNNLAEGSYRYVVSTLSTEGESGPCAPVSVDIVYPDMEAPTSITPTIKNGNDIVLSWNASSYAEEYHLYQIAEDGQKTLVTSTTARAYTISNAPEGNYTFSVSAFHSLYGESPLSTPVDVELVYPIIGAPSNLTYTVMNGNDVTLKWDSVPYATNYKIYKIIDGEKVLESTVSSTSVKYTTVPAGTVVYEVHASSDRFGESVEGSQITVTVSDITMTAPGNLTYKVQNINDIVLAWDSVTNATGYKIYQVIDGQKVLKSTATKTSVTYTKMPAGDYVFEVYSYSDRFGESAEGSQVSLTIEGVALGAPANFQYEIQAGNNIVLSWASVSNAESYKVYQIVDDQRILKSTVTGTTVTYTNMPEGEYQYEVHSYSSRFGESVEGSQLSLVLVHPTMQPPTNLVQTVKSESSFTLSWEASPYATNYKVYQIVNGQKVLKSTVSTTTVTYSNMAPGEYTYIVNSYSTRFGESVEGAQLTFTMEGQVLAPPTNATYAITNGNDIKLTWTAAEYATGYKIYQVIDGEKILKTSVTGTYYTFTNLPSGDYKFIIHTYSTLFGESPEGAEVTISLVVPTMAAPDNLTYKVQNGNYVVLSWEAVQYANSYKVYELIDGQKVLKNTVTSLSTTISNVPAGNHTFIVHSVSSRFGESPIGSEISLTMNEYTMAPPANLTQSIKNGNDIYLKWDAVTYATAYKVYQIIDGQPVLQRTVTSAATTFTNMPEGEYTYEIHSYSDRFGESPEGSQVSFKLTISEMRAPANLTQSIRNGNDIYLKWDAVTYATAYKVYQIIDGQPVLQRTVTSTATTFTNMPEGEYTYEIHSYSDRFGESPEGSQVFFELTFPTMQAPGNLTQSISNGNDIYMRWSAADYAKSYNVYQIIDGKPVLQRTVTGTSVAFTNMPEGEYTYEVHSYSDRFGESSLGSTVNFTLTWPIVVPPQLTGTVFNANNITLTWQKATWANEYRLYQITGDTKQLVYKGTALSFKVYNLTEDTHSFEVTAYSNRFGESKPSNQVTEKIVYPIMQPPTVSLKLLSNTSALVLWDFITYANGYNIYEMMDGKPVLVAEKVNNLSYTLSNLSYANHEYYVTSYSNSFGESEPSNIVLAKLIVDTEAPITTANAPMDWTNQNPVITLSATDNEAGVANTYYSLNDSAFVEGTTVTIEKEGVNKLSFYSVDKVGNIETAHTIYVRVDQTAPVTKVNEVPTGYTKPITLKLDVTDEQSGVAKTYYSINGSQYMEGTSFLIEKEGVNEVSFYSIDQAGNVENTQTVTVKVDNVSPVTTSNAPETWSKENVLVNLTAKDELSGVSKTFYSINGLEYVEGTSLTVENEGINKLSFYSVDHAGNIETAQTVEVKIDKTAPIVSLDLNEEYELGSSLPIQYTANDDLSGIVSDQLMVYGPNETAGKAAVNGTNLVLDKPGVYKLTVTATNGAGLTTIIEKQIVVYIPATIEVTPKVIKGNNGIFTVRVDLPNKYSSKGFDLNTAKLNGINALNSNNGYYNQAKNGQFKFERSDFNWIPSEMTVEFRCYLDGYLIVGQTNVKVQK
ncbi:OmpL47-type beta-barrel domain-containing protein [Schinkia sp. CFF1]